MGLQRTCGMRQSSLAVEKKFPTDCPFLKIVTGHIGEYAVDIYNLVQFLDVLDFDSLGIASCASFQDWMCGLIFCKEHADAALHKQHMVILHGTPYKLELGMLKKNTKGAQRKQRSCCMCRGVDGRYVMTHFMCPIEGCNKGLCSPAHKSASGGSATCFLDHLVEYHQLGGCPQV